MKVIRHSDRNFRTGLAALLKGMHEIPPEVMKRASSIFDDVEKNGVEAVAKWTAKLDRNPVSGGRLRVTDAEMKKALAQVPGEDMEVIEFAAARIEAFHSLQVKGGFRYDDGAGTVIEERVTALDRAGICIPGGRAPLASTVLMTAIPAKLAGVSEIVMISPWPGGSMNAHVLAAAKAAGVDAIFKIGGVQGVAALALGAGKVPRCDKIVGPGSIWVTAGKSIAQSRGLCGIDSLAGPSEILIIADENAPARLVAIDLLSQAEHGEDSNSILVTVSKKLLSEVGKELKKLANEFSNEAPAMSRAAEQVTAVLVKDMEQAIEVSNLVAPEHLEVMASSPKKIIKKLRHGASIFVGPYSPVPAGDYLAGGNHVLPTGGSARFSSPLSVEDFVKRQTITRLSKKALKDISGAGRRLAEMEGLAAHSLSIKSRFKK